MAVLKIQRLSKRFGDRVVIDALNLEVEAGSIYGFIGQNGAGKTTTMRMIVGLLAADNGTIYVNGEKVTYGANQTNQYIGYLPDVPEFYHYMTATEYLQLCASITGMTQKSATKRIISLLTLVGLEQNKQRIRGYSRGMKQRLGIAQALLNKPKLLICDEPTSALDPVGRKEILDILQAVKKETTILFSTHILADVERICDKVGMIHNGKLVLEGTIEEIKAQNPACDFEIEFSDEQTCQSFIDLFGKGNRIGHENLQLRYKNQTSESYEQALRICVEHHLLPQRFQWMEPTLEKLFIEVIQKNETIHRI